MFVTSLFMNLPMKPRYLLIKVLKKLNAAICSAFFLDDIDVFCTFAYTVYVVVLLSFLSLIIKTQIMICMKKSLLHLCALFVLLFSSSCSNSSLDDCDILGIGRADSEIFKQPGWKISLSELLQANACVMDSSGLSFVSATLLDTCIPDSSMFFNNKYLAFPIYLGSLSKFTLVPYSVIKDDTLTYHHKSAYLESYIDSLLNNQNSFETVELLWNYKGTATKTIALFNKQTSELEYDNILFNIISIVRANSATEKKKMSRSEGDGTPWSGNLGDEYEIIHFISDEFGYAASISFWWTEQGHWANDTYDLPNDSVMHVKHYVHDRYDYRFIPYVNYQVLDSGVVAIGSFLSQSCQSGYAFQYYMYAGRNLFLPSESDILDHIKVPGREYQTFFVYHYEKFDNSDKIDYYDYSYLQACYKQESYPITCTYSPK